MKRRDLESLVFLLLVGLLFTLAAWNAGTFPMRARVFPQVVACAAIVLVVAELVRMFIARHRAVSVRDLHPEENLAAGERPAFTDQFVAGLPYLLWIGGFYLLIFVAGFLVASGVFVFFFLTFVGKMRWYAAVGTAVALILALLFLQRTMSLTWPAGLLEAWLGQPVV